MDIHLPSAPALIIVLDVIAAAVIAGVIYWRSRKEELVEDNTLPGFKVAHLPESEA